MLKVENLLKNYGHVYMQNELDYGFSNLVEHHIELTDYNPIRVPERRIPPNLMHEVKKTKLLMVG